MRKITILIADDHKLVRESLATMLETNPRFEIIGLCKDGEEAVQKAGALKPDILLIDINMPVLDGYQATKMIRECAPATKVVCLSMHTEPSTTNRMMQAGAYGYVTKKSSHNTLIKAILDVYDGHRFLCGEVSGWSGNAENGLSNLTKREITIVSFVRDGLSSKEIGTELSLSPKTVESHRYNILRKLKLSNSASLVNYANEHGFAFLQ